MKTVFAKTQWQKVKDISGIIIIPLLVRCKWISLCLHVSLSLLQLSVCTRVCPSNKENPGRMDVTWSVSVKMEQQDSTDVMTGWYP